MAADAAPTLTVPAGAQAGPGFDVERATEAWLGTLSPEQRAKSDAYFEGGYVLQLVDFLYGLGVAALFLLTPLSRRLRAAADRQVYVPPTSFAWTHLGLGDVDSTFSWLGRAVEAGDRMMVPIQLYWFFDPLRDDPRFTDLLRRMKLTALNRVAAVPSS